MKLINSLFCGKREKRNEESERTVESLSISFHPGAAYRYASDEIVTTSSKRTPKQVFKSKKESYRKFRNKVNMGLYLFQYTPLHIASADGLPLEIIHCLLDQHGTNSLLEPDVNGRLPLHHIAKMICLGGVPFSYGKKVIELFCILKPSALHVLDKLSVAPIDIFMNRHIELESKNSERDSSVEEAELNEIISFMRKASIQEYRIRRKKWEDKGYTHRAHASQGSALSMNALSGSSYTTSCAITLPDTLGEHDYESAV